MKQGIGSGYLEFVQSQTRAVMGHLYQFVSAAGQTDSYTDLDVDVTALSVVWKSGGVRIDGLRRKLDTGFQIDEQKIKIFALPSDTLFGGVFLPAMSSGVMDGGSIYRWRIVFPLVTGNAAYDVQNPPIGAPYVWQLFIGYMGQIEKAGQTHVEAKVRSPLVKLEVNMPRNYYQPGCNWTLFDAGCTLDKASFGTDYIVASVNSNQSIFPVGGVATPTGGDGLQNYSGGRLLFTSGTLAGTQVLIDNNNSFGFGLAYVLDVAPNPGDAFTVYPGCSKSFATCQQKFANDANFRGFDKVPPVMLSI
jgi:hypothetical protein